MLSCLLVTLFRGQGHCLLLVVVPIGLGRAFASAFHVGFVARAAIAGAVAATELWT